MTRYEVSFGPGRLTFTVKWLLIVNIALYLVTALFGGEFYRLIIGTFGLTPRLVFEQFWLWQVVTYMFLHGGLSHILFNMLALWMFGVPLENRWGYLAFAKFYAACGIGAGVTSLIVSWLPFEFAQNMYHVPTIGASGAIYGILVAFGMLFPHQTVLLLVFPVPARVYVWIVGAMVLLSSIGDPNGGVAHVAHLGGMLTGYLYLIRGRGGPWAEIKYRVTKWRMNRARRKFGVHPGGRGGGGWVH